MLATENIVLVRNFEKLSRNLIWSNLVPVEIIYKIENYVGNY